MNHLCRICERPTERYALRCNRCYQYWYTHQSERPRALDLRGRARKCRLAACTRRERRLSRGLCHMHYLRWWRLFGGKVA